MKNLYHNAYPKFSRILFYCFIYLLSSTAYAQTTYTVNSTADNPDADLTDNICADSNGNCTLRAAIENANKISSRDRVHFSLAGTGPHKIILAENLPKITQPIELDATTQPGYAAGAPLIVLDGNNVPRYPSGTSPDSIPIGFYLKENSGGSLVKGFVFGGFGESEHDENGELIHGTHFAGFAIYSWSSDNVFQANFVGIAADGKTPFRNSWGIAVYQPNNLIGGPDPGDRNIISGQWVVGLQVSREAVNTKVLGNYLGTTADGLEKVGNFSAIQVVATGVDIQHNVISGNTRGIHVTADANVILNNYIGVDATGTVALPNVNGIILDARNNVVGKKDNGNVISGNQVGILINSYYHMAGSNIIQANLIGTDKTGNTAVPNETGIAISEGRSTSNLIGGVYSGEGNLISGNLKDGIMISNRASSNYVYGNIIGAKPDGNTPLPNGANGVHIKHSSNNSIGSKGTNSGNTIAYNGANGILVTQEGTGYSYSTSNTLSSNKVFGNALLGIDLNGEGITENDRDDSDEGPNQLQNFPVISNDAAYAGADLSLSYYVSSSPRHVAYPIRVEFYIADNSRQGKVFLYADTFTETDYKSKGSKSKAITIAGVTLAAGDKILATATDANGNTSEFGAAVAVQVNDGCNSPVTYYADGDGDGYGVDAEATNITSCEDPEAGYVTVAGDCDDTDDTVYPGAIEILDDGIDQNCDGRDVSAICQGSDILTITELCSDNPAIERRWSVSNPGTCSTEIRWEVQKGGSGGPEIVQANGSIEIITGVASKGTTKVTFYWKDSNGLEVKTMLTSSGNSCTTSATTSSSLISADGALEVYPNPLASEGLWLDFGNSNDNAQYHGTIYDLSGRKLADRLIEVDSANRRYLWKVDHGEWSAGMYILIIKSDKQTYQFRIVK